MSVLCPEALAARAAFPRGLIQPPGSFRFSEDALRLANFLEPRGRVLDLGTGCGVVALAVLLVHEGARAVGIERNAVLVEAARENAIRLGLADRFAVLRGDIADLAGRQAEGERESLEYDATAGRGAGEAPGDFGEDLGLFDLVLANPPFRQAARGRVPANALRREALFEEANTLDIFCAAAANALAPEGRFGVIFPAERERELVDTLAQNGLTAERVLPVLTSVGKAPKRILVEAAPLFG
jgi:tRNA1(Val) A37 N6-methylase TrmN6